MEADEHACTRMACPVCRALKDHLLATAASLTGGAVAPSSGHAADAHAAAEPSSKRSRAGGKASAAGSKGKVVAGKRRKAPPVSAGALPCHMLRGMHACIHAKVPPAASVGQAARKRATAWRHSALAVRGTDVAQPLCDHGWDAPIISVCI